MMNRACDQFFTRPALAVDQDRRFTRRNLPDQRKHLLHGSGSANEIDKDTFVLQFTLETFGFFSQSALADARSNRIRNAAG
jgi:hypothetical protein